MPLQHGSLFGVLLRLVVQPLKRAEARAPFAPPPIFIYMVTAEISFSMEFIKFIPVRLRPKPLISLSPNHDL